MHIIAIYSLDSFLIVLCFFIRALTFLPSWCKKLQFFSQKIALYALKCDVRPIISYNKETQKNTTRGFLFEKIYSGNSFMLLTRRCRCARARVFPLHNFFLYYWRYRNFEKFSDNARRGFSRAQRNAECNGNAAFLSRKSFTRYF